MLGEIESANITHSMWCEQVAEQDFEYVGCTCGALKQEMLRLRMVKDAERYRWMRANADQVGELNLLCVEMAMPGFERYATAEELDAAVDAAMLTFDPTAYPCPHCDGRLHHTNNCPTWKMRALWPSPCMGGQ